MDFFFMINNGNIKAGDEFLFFNQKDTDKIKILNIGSDMADVLTICGIFSSRSQAKKNWKLEMIIPDGFSEWRGIGKLKHNIFILNPIPD